MKSVAKSDLFRELPSVDEVLRMPGVEALATEHEIAPAPRPHVRRSRVCGMKSRLDCSTNPHCDLLSMV